MIPTTTSQLLVHYITVPPQLPPLKLHRGLQHRTNQHQPLSQNGLPPTINNAVTTSKPPNHKEFNSHPQHSRERTSRHINTTIALVIINKLQPRNVAPGHHHSRNNPPSHRPPQPTRRATQRAETRLGASQAHGRAARDEEAAEGQEAAKQSANGRVVIDST